MMNKDIEIGTTNINSSTSVAYLLSVVFPALNHVSPNAYLKNVRHG